MHILWAIIAGLVIGVIARALLRGRQDIPIWLTIVLGIIGGLVGDAIASGLGVRHTDGLDWIRHILQIAAAMVLIAVIAPFWSRRRHLTR